MICKNTSDNSPQALANPHSHNKPLTPVPSGNIFPARSDSFTRFVGSTLLLHQTGKSLLMR
jgi:hypothetical protein